MVKIQIGEYARIEQTNLPVYGQVGVVIQHIDMTSRTSNWVMPEEYYHIMLVDSRQIWKVYPQNLTRVTQEWVEVPGQEGRYHGKHRKA